MKMRNGRALSRASALSPPALQLTLLLCLALNVSAAEPARLAPQSITLPAQAGQPLFTDIDGDGRADLLVIDLLDKKLLTFRQRPTGFTNAPDQIVSLPPQTAWVALGDVDAHPGLELLMSTATGLVYSRQTAGIFETERRTLLAATQVFTNSDSPILTLLSTNRITTNDSIPVISAGQAVLYHRDSAYHWTPDSPVRLAPKPAAWVVDRDEWMLGPHPAHRLSLQQAFRSNPNAPVENDPEAEALRERIEGMKKHAVGILKGTNRLDINGDGREDLVLSESSIKLDFRTDLAIYLRGADQQLPSAPTQVLHCRGLPIPLLSTKEMSSVADLDGDGVPEVVLLEIKTSITSPSGLLEMVLTHGVEWLLTIRTFKQGAFSASPVASLPIKLVLSLEDLKEWPVFIQGDFNGDGRADFLVRRSETQWNVFTSTGDGRWFAPQPTLTFDAPTEGSLEIKDLDGDGLSDIIWHRTEKPGLVIFLSPPARAKGNNP